MVALAVSVLVWPVGLSLAHWDIGWWHGLTGPYQALLTARKVNGPSAPVTPSPTT